MAPALAAGWSAHWRICGLLNQRRKAHITGASGGVVFSRNEKLYQNALAHADRGKPRWIEGFDDRYRGGFLFPRSICTRTKFLAPSESPDSPGLRTRSLSGLTSWVRAVRPLFSHNARFAALMVIPRGTRPSVYPVMVDATRLRCSPAEFAEAGPGRRHWP